MNMRKTWLYTITLIAVFGLFFVGCEKSNNPLATNDGTPDFHPPWDPLEVQIHAGNANDTGEIVGTVGVSNDGTNLYVEFTTTGDWYFEGTHLGVYLDDEDIPNWPNRPQGGHLNIQPHPTFDPPVQYYKYIIPNGFIDDYYEGLYWNTVGTELWIVAHLELVKIVNGTIVQTETGFGGDIYGGGSAWWWYFTYTVQTYTPPPEGLRTQTQGGWGAPPHGNNPGQYLVDNWDGNVVVGTGYSLTFTSAHAIELCLPQGGKPAVLTQSWVDPTEKVSVLWGQMVALKLNVTFFDDLLECEIAEGTFEGWTVEEFLVVAEAVFGGSSTAYTPQEINECASSINENYVDGVEDHGFLIP